MEVWIGTVHVKPKPGNEDLGEAVGAYVSTLALADSEETYSIRVYELFDEWDFEDASKWSITSRFRFVARMSPWMII